MRIAYFDCSSGIAGNMILGALIDAGLEASYLKKELSKLRTRGWELEIKKVKRNGVQGTFADIKTTKEKNHRRLRDILAIINKSRLNENIKSLSSKIFKKLAEAEAKVHGVSVNEIQFHEIGAVDAIIDIVGACIGIDRLGIERVYSSPLPSGKGKIKHAHGILPVPAPATTELIKNVPTYGLNIQDELVTPTGAAIITTLARDFGDIPRIKLSGIGNGAGTKVFPSLSNLLRIFIGEAQIPSERDAILQIEANIDDMDPKLYSNVIAKLMKVGALDAYIIPLVMKKQREGINLVVLCAPEKREEIITQIFNLTTTLGVRTYLVTREKLLRKFRTVKTNYGKAKVKLGYLGKELKTVAPEYNDYKRLARKHHIPIQRAYKEIKQCL